VSESALTSRITAVRKAIGDSGATQQLIRTLPRKGIRFVGIVREEEQSPKLIDAERAAIADPRSPPVLRGHEATPAPRLSIVVLPFENLSSDPEQEYFADGITDDLTTDLSRISGSFVIARSTACTFKDKPVDVRRIGHDLGVRYILEGSVRRTGDQVRVNVQLIDAISGAHLWADRFDTERANLAEAQDEITGRLARTLNFALVEDVSRRIDREKIIDPDARDLVMRGWASLIRSSSSQARQVAQRTFERALVLDPQSVDAKVYLAITLVINLLDGWSGSPLEDQARAEQLLLEVLEHDSNLAKSRWVCFAEFREC
jgi:adenylate cyclase